MKIIINPNQIEIKKWSDFVKNHPNGNIFQTVEMYEVYEKTKNYEPIFVAIADERNEILALLLAVIQKENVGILGTLTARSIIFGGPLLSGNESILLDILLKEYIKLIQSKAIYTQIRNFVKIDNDLIPIYSKHGFIYEDHLNILLDLTIGIDLLWKGIKRNRKDGINKAKKQGFVMKISEKLDTVEKFYLLTKDLYDNIGIPFPDKSLFYNFNNNINGNLKWFTLEFNGEPYIILCAFHFNNVLYAFSIGIRQDPDFQKLRPVDYFYWEVIKWSSENGLHIFDWMGAGKPQEEYGVRKFKLQFGGEIKEFGRCTKIHKPILFELGKNTLKIWQKLKK